MNLSIEWQMNRSPWSLLYTSRSSRSVLPLYITCFFSSNFIRKPLLVINYWITILYFPSLIQFIIVLLPSLPIIFSIMVHPSFSFELGSGGDSDWASVLWWVNNLVWTLSCMWMLIDTFIVRNWTQVPNWIWFLDWSKLLVNTSL